MPWVIRDIETGLYLRPREQWTSEGNRLDSVMTDPEVRACWTDKFFEAYVFQHPPVVQPATNKDGGIFDCYEPYEEVVDVFEYLLANQPPNQTETTWQNE